MLAVQADGAEVVTIEGLSDSGEVADLQAEFEARNAAQCGYCTPGMVITSAELVAAGGTPDRSNSRSSVRQFVPLYRLPGDYRCRRGNHEKEVQHVTPRTVTVMKDWSAKAWRAPTSSD